MKLIKHEIAYGFVKFEYPFSLIIGRPESFHAGIAAPATTAAATHYAGAQLRRCGSRYQIYCRILTALLSESLSGAVGTEKHLSERGYF